MNTADMRWNFDKDEGDWLVMDDSFAIIAIVQEESDVEPEDVARLLAAAPELLEACQTFAEWLRREDAGSEGQPWAGKRGTPEGEATWREWWDENLRICNLANEQVRAAIAKATGAA